MISGTLLDFSFPPTQFCMSGFSKPYRVNGNNSGGGILPYIRKGIIFKSISV